jgi:anti-anti-sigma factor
MDSEGHRSDADEIKADRVTVVHLTGDKMLLHEETHQDTLDRLMAVTEQPDHGQVVLDMGNVASISSMGLGLLLKLHKRLKAAGRRLTLCNLCPLVNDVFAVTRLNTVLDLHSAQPGPMPFHHGGRDGFGVSVLVVDDTDAVRSCLETALRRMDYQAFVAANGHQAIGLYLRYHEEIAVVLLDVQMPGLDGPTTLAALQKIDPTVRCCFLTGNPKPYTELALLRKGAVRVFRKPFAVADVAEIVGTVGQLAGPPSPSRLHRWIEIIQQGG